MWEDKIPDYHRRDLFYFDSETYFWIKWETLTSDGRSKPVLERTRILSKIDVSDEVPPGKIWRYAADKPSVLSRLIMEQGDDSMRK
jgi:hypothetical protein